MRVVFFNEAVLLLRKNVSISVASSTFRYFLSFLKQKYPSIECADEITTEVTRDYVYYMSKEKRLWWSHESILQYKTDKKGLSPFTVNIRLRTLKCYFKFLTDEGYIRTNPTTRVKLMKTEEDTIQAFSKHKSSIYWISQIKGYTQVSTIIV